MQEVFKKVEIDERYEVSNLGRIRKLLKTGKYKYLCEQTKRRYFTVNIRKKSIDLHRLIIQTFLPKENSENLVVNHIDGNRYNNRLENLEWCTQKENIQHSISNHYIFSNKDRKDSEAKRLDALRKKVFCKETNTIYDSITIASKKLNLHYQNISACCKGKLNKTGDYHFCYA